ncbi:MAG: hypothetical protein ACPL4E_00910 [Thermoproteota archaeon]
MSLPKTAFISGLILVAAGIVIAVTPPAKTSWELRSRVLVDGETLNVSAGWRSNSRQLVKQVLSVEPPLKHAIGLGAAFFPGGGKDFVVAGSAVELSSPPRPFNFYVFDDVNYGLWEAGLAYRAFYEDRGRNSTSFSFSIASKEALPDLFYFVVEESGAGLRPVVLVDSTISWTEKTLKTECSEYVCSSPPFLVEEARDFRIRGNATEESGNRFNFYVMDYSNYWNWLAGGNYTAIFERNNVETVGFDAPLTESQAKSILYFVVENPLKDVDESVSLNAVLEWREKTAAPAILGGWVVGSIVASIGLATMVAAGAASLVSKRRKIRGENMQVVQLRA